MSISKKDLASGGPAVSGMPVRSKRRKAGRCAAAG